MYVIQCNGCFFVCLFCFAFLFCYEACRILLPRPGTEPMPATLGAQSLNHWTTGEVQFAFSFIRMIFCLCFQWTWIWANSERQWRTVEPGMLQSTGSQRVGHNLVTEQQQNVYEVVKERIRSAQYKAWRCTQQIFVGSTEWRGSREEQPLTLTKG